MTSAASRLLREVRDISSQQIPVVFGEPEEADILHWDWRRGGGRPPRQGPVRPSSSRSQVPERRGAHTRSIHETASHVRARRRGCCLCGILDEIYLTVAFYTCELCAQKRHENAHTLNTRICRNCKLKCSLARSNLIFWQLPLQM